MAASAFHPRFEQLPELLPIFPLGGVLLLPGGQLPLNIFEPRYLAMVSDALGQGRMIGMIQPLDPDSVGPESVGTAPPLYDVGCAGRITSFTETEDGRFLISLQGVCRFRIGRELDEVRGYRRIAPDWRGFEDDLAVSDEISFERDRLLSALRPFLRQHNMEVNWKAVEAASNLMLLTSLAMICPFEPREKQAILETPTMAERAEVMTALLEMAVVQGAHGAGPARQ